MKKVRYNVWETNSSSSHTVTVRGKRNIDKYRYTQPNRIIKVKLDEYGWHGDPCDSFQSKLAYALSMVLNTEYPYFEYWDENFVIDQDTLEKCEGYQIILNAIQLHMDVFGILIERNRGYYPYGYIDHQSCESYHSLQDFLDDWNVDIERFLFDDGVVVWILNDNG